MKRRAPDARATAGNRRGPGRARARAPKPARIGRMERMSRVVTDATGSTAALTAAIALIVGWLASGPLFHFSDTWQLVINTTTTIVTFLMVFLIQRAQNKDARAMETKLNELIAAVEGASNRLIDVESLSEEELETLHGHFQRLAALAQTESTITRSHSIEEADSRHRSKHPRRAG